MEVITVNGKTVELDGNGFLTNPDAWNLDVANYFAAIEGIQMTGHHQLLRVRSILLDF